MTTPEERDIVETARRVLHRSERDCDELTVARLRAARRRALEAEPRPAFRRWSLAGAVAAAATIAGLAGVLWLQTPSDMAPVPTASSVADIDLLTTNESPEFYNDLDFYDWLATDSDAG
ncbi:MAG: hypothetical protein ACJ8KA_12050 [Sulfurifustis sp.]